MKISFNWIKELLNQKLTIDQTSDLLTDIGLEVEGIEDYNSAPQTDLSQLASALQTASSTAVEIGSGATTNKSQTYEFICSVVNNNVVRISGGALGFPIL